MRSPNGSQPSARRAAFAIACAAALCCASPRAGAQSRQCPVMAGASTTLGDADVSVRLGFIQRQLRRGAARSLAWAATWGSLYTAIVGGQLVRLAVSEGDSPRIQAGIGAGSTAVAALFVAVLPPAIIANSRRLDARLARMRSNNEACAALADAERFLSNSAANQVAARSWYMNLVAGLYSLGVGLAIGLATTDWTAAVLTTLGGSAVGQLMNLTRPSDGIAALRRYRAGDLRPAPAPSTSYWVAGPTLGRGHVGVSATVAF